MMKLADAADEREEGEVQAEYDPRVQDSIHHSTEQLALCGRSDYRTECYITISLTERRGRIIEYFV